MKNADRFERMLRRLILVCAVIAALSCGGTALAADENADAAQTESSTDLAKYINVVYDDSGSMIKSDGDASTAEFYDKWCQAKYALEVFSTMLSEDDTMNVYAMSDGGEVSLTISGATDAQERADTIHGWESYSYETPYSVVEAAYADLQAQGSDVETWLFVITDGAFDDGETSTTTVKNHFDEYTESGVKVIYLGIGSDAAEYQSNTAEGLYCYHAADTADGESSEILDYMTEISSLISARLELDNDQYAALSDGTLTLTLNAPMEEIIIFAQGDSVKISDMSNADCEVETESATEVTYSEAPTAELQSRYGDKLVVADYLSGVVQTFVSADDGGVLSAGTYTVSVSGISDLSDVKIYYKLKVDAALDITQNGEDVEEGGYIEPGEVTIQAKIQDPQTQVTVESDLLDGATVTYSITSGGETFTVTNDGDSDLYDGSVSEDGTYTFTAEGGEMEVVVSVEVEEGNTVSASYTYKVVELLSDLTIDEVSLEDMDGGGNFKKVDLIESPGYALITVRQEGEPLTEEYWMATEVVIETPEDSCLNVEVVSRGEEVSTYLVEVTYYYDGDKHKLKDEVAECTVTATLELDGKAAKSDGAVSTVTAARLTWQYLLNRYKKELIALAVILVIVIGYLPGVKKRFPKSMSKRPAIRESSVDGLGRQRNDRKGRFEKKTMTVILPYRREKGSIKFLPPGVSGFSKIQVRAVNKSEMEITNANSFTAPKKIKFNGQKIEKGTKKAKVSTPVKIVAELDNQRYTVEL